MKKRLLVAAIVTAITLSTGVTMANPVELTGQFSEQYRKDTTDNKAAQGSFQDGSDWKTQIILNAKTELAPNLELFARFGAEGLSDRNFAESLEAHQENKDFIGGIDQYGVVYKNAGTTYTLGRQALKIGANGTIYFKDHFYGKHIFDDGLKVNTKSGITNLELIAAQQDYAGDKDNKIYAMQASVKATKDMTVGAVVAQYDRADNVAKDLNFWAVNTTYNSGKATYLAEYAKSNADSKNKAYNCGINYGFDAKNSLTAIYQRTEENGDITNLAGPGTVHWTAFDGNEKGLYYIYNHKFSKETGFELKYIDNKTIKDGVKNTSLRASVSYSF